MNIASYLSNVQTNKKLEKMYTLDCSYYNKTFPSIQQLITDILVSGMDPSYEIVKNGICIGEYASDYLTF